MDRDTLRGRVRLYLAQSSTATDYWDNNAIDPLIEDAKDSIVEFLRELDESLFLKNATVALDGSSEYNVATDFLRMSRQGRNAWINDSPVPPIGYGERKYRTGVYVRARKVGVVGYSTGTLEYDYQYAVPEVGDIVDDGLDHVPVDCHKAIALHAAVAAAGPETVDPTSQLRQTIGESLGIELESVRNRYRAGRRGMLRRIGARLMEVDPRNA